MKILDYALFEAADNSRNKENFYVNHFAPLNAPLTLILDHNKILCINFDFLKVENMKFSSNVLKHLRKKDKHAHSPSWNVKFQAFRLKVFRNGDKRRFRFWYWYLVQIQEISDLMTGNFSHFWVQIEQNLWSHDRWFLWISRNIRSKLMQWFM